MTSQTFFDGWFESLTTHASSPRQWQSELAAEQSCRNRLIRIPTGLGKTEGVLAAWSFHRLCRNDDRWPSWRERCLGLLNRFGPAGLAYLESLLRAADIRGSRLKTNDSELAQELKAGI